jgi:hypothetical protein
MIWPVSFGIFGLAGYRLTQSANVNWPSVPEVAKLE